MVKTKGFFSRTYECDWCNYSSKDENTTIIHEETCTTGPSVNPLSIIEYMGSATADFRFEDGGSFREFEEISERLAKFKGHGWIIYRKANSSYTIQWTTGVGIRSVFEYVVNGNVAEEKWDVSFEESIELAIKWITELNPEYAYKLENIKNKQIETKKKLAMKREEALDYNSAIKIWEELGEINEAARVRKLKAEQSAVKVDQTVVHGDYVDDRDTIVKDSVINRSNVGSGGDDKFTKLKELKEMLSEGLINDDEFKQMKKEILGI